jgi:hypothetical protein
MIIVVKPTFKSIVVTLESGEEQRINVGDRVKFVALDTGEKKNGVLSGLSNVNRKGNFSLSLQPDNASYEETWKSENIADNTLELATDEE